MRITDTRYEKLIYYFLLAIPFVDMVTGFALNRGSSGLLTYITQAHRLLLFFFLVFQVLLRERISPVLLLVGGYFLLLPLLQALWHGSPKGVPNEYINLIKLFIPILMIEFYRTGDEWEGPVFRATTRAMDAFTWIYPLSLLLPRLLKLGFTQYYGSGYTGFYFAGNDLSVIFSFLYILIYVDLVEHKHYTWQNGLRLIMLIMSHILLGGKTGFMVILLMPLFSLMRLRTINARRFKWVIFLAIFSVLAFYVLSEQLMAVFVRILDNLQKRMASQNGFLAFLLSGRNLRIGPSISYWYEDLKDFIFYFLFGIGQYWKIPVGSIDTNPFSLIEMDLFDSLFWYGILATGFLVLYYLSIYKQGKLRGPRKLDYKVSFIFMAFYSIFLGHVLYSSTVSVFFGLLVILYLGRQETLSSEGSIHENCHLSN
ncbi:O-antigen ligase family protein [Kallipyga massiliensis]|uniref:O-antigen ligase family protein n=1 Tax=Kallipyga massiliensis TaxID=1472764 RepID=UPI0004B82A2E|nr:O-antigen ligase family protein [Kallipyga massiliensis]